MDLWVRDWLLFGISTSQSWHFQGYIYLVHNYLHKTHSGLSLFFWVIFDWRFNLGPAMHNTCALPLFFFLKKEPVYYFEVNNLNVTIYLLKDLWKFCDAVIALRKTALNFILFLGKNCIGQDCLLLSCFYFNLITKEENNRGAKLENKGSSRQSLTRQRTFEIFYNNAY